MSPAHLSAGERTDQARPEGDVGGKQPVQEGQRLRGGKGNRRHQRAGQAEEENERYDRLDSGVREHPVDGHVAELEDHDRGRHQAAAERDGDNRPQKRRQRRSLEQALERSHRHEDGNDGRERELEAGIEERARIPDEQREGSKQQEVPAIAWPRRQPGQRGERSSHGCPHHRRLQADHEHVSHDRRQRQHLAQAPGYAAEPGEAKHTSNEKGNVLARDREQVVETGAPEGLAQLSRETFVLAQHETQYEPAPLTGQPKREIVCEPLAQAVAETADASAPADAAPGARSQNDVYSLASEPGSLVEAARGRPRRQLYLGAELEHGPDRWRLTGREREPDALAKRSAPEALDLPWGADRVGARAHRAGYDDPSRGALTNV